MERSRAGTKKKKSRRPITTYLKYSNNKHNLLIFYKIRKKFNEIQLQKKLKGLEQSKNDESSTLLQTTVTTSTFHPLLHQHLNELLH